MGCPSDLFHASFAGLSGQGHLQCCCNVASVMGFHSALPGFIYEYRSLQPIMQCTSLDITQYAINCSQGLSFITPCENKTKTQVLEEIQHQ